MVGLGVFSARSVAEVTVQAGVGHAVGFHEGELPYAIAGRTRHVGPTLSPFVQVELPVAKRLHLYGRFVYLGKFTTESETELGAGAPVGVVNPGLLMPRQIVQNSLQETKQLLSTGARATVVTIGPCRLLAGLALGYEITQWELQDRRFYGRSRSESDRRFFLDGNMALRYETKTAWSGECGVACANLRGGVGRHALLLTCAAGHRW